MVERDALAYLPIYKALRDQCIDFAVIGGQACNIWSLIYSKRQPELDQYQPFTSPDLDICTHSQEDVTLLARTLGNSEATLNRPDSSSPEMGIVLYKSLSGTLPVTFITGAYGISDPQKVFSTRQTLALLEDEIPVDVTHPFLTMQSKATLVVRPPRGHKPNDFKHLCMSVHYVRGFILDLLQQGEDRQALEVCKKVLALARSRVGISLFRGFGIGLEGSLPSAESLPDAAVKTAAFMNLSLPGWIHRIETRRN